MNVTTPNAGCYNGEFWEVSQAAPLRRVQINGTTTLQDYCTQPNYASGGFIADSKKTGSKIKKGSQQQVLFRNSQISGWGNGLLDQGGFWGLGAPPPRFPPSSTFWGPDNTLAISPVR